MFVHLHQNIILKNPKSVFFLLLIALLSFGYFSKDFRLDASSETLLIEGDPDLQYLKEVTERYGSRDFLILTHTPNEGMITNTRTKLAVLCVNIGEQLATRSSAGLFCGLIFMF